MLLIVPLVSLSILWAFAASLTLGDGLNLRHVQALHDHAGYPAGALATSLQAERELTFRQQGEDANVRCVEIPQLPRSDT